MELRILGPILTVLAPALAGCLGGGGSGGPTESPEPAAPVYDASQSFGVGYNASQCREGVVVVLVEFAQAQKHLPKGFKARDAQGLLGLPASSGRGAVALNAVNCGQSELTAQDVSEGKLVVYVDPPNVAGERPPAEPNFYEVARYTPNEEMLRLLRAVGWRALEGSVAIAIQTQASGAATGNGEVRDDEGIVVHTFGMTAPAPAPLAGLARFWHDTPGGVAYFDYKADTNVAQGSGSCSIKSGSVGHNLTGIQTCPNGQTFSLVFPSYKWEGRFEYLAGTHAA